MILIWSLIVDVFWFFISKRGFLTTGDITNWAEWQRGLLRTTLWTVILNFFLKVKNSFFDFLLIFGFKIVAIALLVLEYLKGVTKRSQQQKLQPTNATPA